MSDEIKGNRSGIKFHTGTPTYRLFEVFFLELPPEALPYRLPGDWTKGKSINLAMGLNRCQVQWGKEQGVPKDILTRSAKARQDEAGNWYVEISKSTRHQKNPGASWMNEYLARLGPAPKPAPLVPEPVTEPDPIADALRAKYGDIL